MLPYIVINKLQIRRLKLLLWWFSSSSFSFVMCVWYKGSQGTSIHTGILTQVWFFYHTFHPFLSDYPRSRSGRCICVGYVLGRTLKGITLCDRLDDILTYTYLYISKIFCFRKTYLIKWLTWNKNVNLDRFGLLGFYIIKRLIIINWFSSKGINCKEVTLFNSL